MELKMNLSLETSFPESLSAGALSIAVIGPNAALRKAIIGALAGCHTGPVNEFSSYPPGVDDLPRLLGQRHDIIMIEWDANPEFALDLVETVCASGKATVMVYSQESDPDLSDSHLLMRCMRAGAREFLGMPFTHSSMAEALVRAAARKPPTPVARRAGGRLLVFCGAKGGAGVTAIACNFALALARESSESTLFIDLDIPLGDAALNLGVVPEYSTVDALQNYQRLDSSFLSRLLVSHTSGLSVLAAPGRHSSYRATEDAIEKLLLVARQNFQNVVVDAGSKLDLTGSADAFNGATTIYLVTQAAIPELRNANRMISQYFHAETPRLEIVLNRCDTRSPRISEEHIKKALTRTAKWRIPNDYVAMRRMQDTATPVVFTDSFISRQLGQMARAACGLAEVPEKKKGFSLKALTKGFSKISETSMSITQSHPVTDSDFSDKVMDTPSRTATERSDALGFASGASTQGRGTADDDARGVRRIYNRNIYVQGADGRWSIEASVADPGNAAQSVTWPAPEPITFSTPLGGAQLNAKARVPGTFSYVPSEGYLLPAGTHSLWVTFTPETGPKAIAVQASVSLRVNKAVPAISWPAPAPIPAGSPLNGNQLNASASVPGRMEYSPAAGTLLPDGRQTLFVSFTPADSANYEVAFAEVPILVVDDRPSSTRPVPSPVHSERA